MIFTRRGFLGLLPAAIAARLCPRPPTAPAVTIGIDLASGPDSTHWYEVTYVTAMGEEIPIAPWIHVMEPPIQCLTPPRRTKTR